jgi:hypothetical protein
MTCYARGDKVWWASPVTGHRTKAVFLQHDVDGFPKRDALLAIKIGNFKQSFRWPLKLISSVDD